MFGYTAANDVSARDLQQKTKNGGQILLAKSLDNFCPLSSHLVTKVGNKQRALSYVDSFTILGTPQSVVRYIYAM